MPKYIITTDRKFESKDYDIISQYAPPEGVSSFQNLYNKSKFDLSFLTPHYKKIKEFRKRVHLDFSNSLNQFIVLENNEQWTMKMK